jgi:tetratricopeptide (TPR) repeat protein
VWGGFQKFGSAIRITSHFTDVSTGNLVGSSKVDGSMNDIFKLQDKIITSLIDTFSLEVSDSELKKIETPETVEVQAYEYYAKGRQIFIQMGRESFDKAQNFLEKALEVDPEYALAYSGLGAIHTLRFIAQTNPEDLEIGISYLQKAAKLDPDLAEPYLWLTYSYTRKQLFEDAIRSGSRAVELEPDNPLAHYFLGVAYHVRAAMEYKTNRYIDAIRHYKRNVELQPSYQIAYMNMAWIYLLHGQYQKARENLERAVAIEESGKTVLVKFVGALTLMGNVYFRQDQLDTALDWYRRSIAVLEKADHVYREPFIALTYCGMGNINFRRCHYDESIEHYKRACDLISQHPRSLGVGYFLLKARLGLARSFHLLGMNRESKQQFQEAFELFKNKEEYDFSWIWEGCDAQAYYDFASYFVVINHQKDAFKYLQKAIECGWRDLPFLQSDDPFSRFRNKTEFAEIVQELKNRKPLP